MLIPCLLLVVSVVAEQEVYESTEDTMLNTTTLYPVTNKTTDINRNYRNDTEALRNNIKNNDFKEANNKQNKNQHDKVEVTTSKKEGVATWTVDTSYVPAKHTESQTIYPQPKDKGRQAIHVQPKDKESEDSNSTDSIEQLSVETPKSNSDEKQFKPSPHLGSFFDEENLNLFKFTTPEPSVFTLKKPAINFLGSKDFHILNYKSPKETYQDQLISPYRFESPHFLTTNNWKQTLESKPTVESSVKIPAGGLYRHANPFKEKPSLDEDIGDFGVGYNEEGREKENPMKKRSNPWKKFVQLVTAFLPIGLIISALTPNLVTLHSTDNDPYLGRLSRRADVGFAGVPTISEHCRRRLLCEIHSEENYLRSESMSGHVRKHCYKLRCEEPQTLRRVLTWLLAHRPGPRHGPPPGAHSQNSHVQDTDVLNYRHKNDYT